MHKHVLKKSRYLTAHRALHIIIINVYNDVKTRTLNNDECTAGIVFILFFLFILDVII